MSAPAPPDPRLEAVLDVAGRCRRTGGVLVCIGHFDHWSDVLYWTRHLADGRISYRVVPYNHPAPETIEVRYR